MVSLARVLLLSALVAGLVVAGLFLSPVPVAAQAVFRVGVDLVSFGVTVVDKRGELVTTLAPDDFVLLEEGKPQRVQYFARGLDGDDAHPPLHLGLLFDTSGSMVEDLSFACGAAIKFLNTVPQPEAVTVVDFDTEVRVARYGPLDFPRLVERLRSRKPDGWTALYDALGVYLDGATGDTGRKVLVIYTDGGDTRSSISFKEARDLVRASDATIYVIGFLEHQSSSSRLDQRMRLQELADISGGQAFFPTSIKQLDDMYAKVLSEIAAQYTLGYQSTNDRTDGAWREVEIKLTRPDLKGAKIRTRKGYFAPYVGAKESRGQQP